MNEIVRSTYNPNGKRILYHLSNGMNTAPAIGQRFMGRGAPLTSLNNPVIDDLMLDVFWCTYVRDMDLRDDVPENRGLNRRLLEFLQSDPNWLNLSNWFAGRKLVAAAVAYETTQRLLEMVDGVAEALQALGGIEHMEKEADDLEKRADEMEREQESKTSSQQDDPQKQDEAGGEGEDDKQTESPDEMRSKAEQLREQADDLREQLEDLESQAESELEDSLAGMVRSSAVNAGQEFGEQVAAFMKAWGLEDGVEIELPIDDIKALMSMVGNPAFGQLSYLMGRIYDLSMGVLTGRSSIDLVLDQPGYTDDVWDIDLVELARLSPLQPEPARMQALSNFYRDGGMWGQTRTAQARNKGTFIACVDESGSMDSPIGRPPASKAVVPSCAVYSKALILGLMNAAVASEQEFYALGFSSAGKVTDVVSNRSPLSERMKFGLHHFDGGTDFTRPLNIALDIFDNLDEEGKQASDILFITDGEDGLGTSVVDRLYEAKQEYGVRLILLLIGEEPHMDGDDHRIETHSDIILSFKSVEETASRIAQALWDSR